MAGEFTGDHHTDIAVATKNGVQVVRNTGNGAMAGPLAADTFFYPHEVIAAPLNNDSNIDLAMLAESDRGVHIPRALFGDGYGGVSNEVRLVPMPFNYAMAVVI